MLDSRRANLQDRSTICVRVVMSLFQYCLERDANLAIALIVELQSPARNH